MLKSAVMLSEAKHLHLAVALALLIGCKGQVREQPGAAPRASQSASQSDIFSGMIGKLVRVSFRRDALGLAANSVPAPTEANITGHIVQLNGIVQSASQEWIVLHELSGGNSGSTYWIPKSAILLIQSDAPSP